jgi:hypothetical protein
MHLLSVKHLGWADARGAARRRQAVRNPLQHNPVLDDLSFVIQSKDVNPRPVTIPRPLSSTRSGDLQRPPRIGSNAGLVWWVNGEEVISLNHDRQA